RATRLCARRRRSGSRGFVGSRRLLRGRSASLTPGTAFGRRRCGLHLGSRGDLLHRTGLLFGLSRHLGLGLGGFLRSLLLGLLLGHVASPLFRAPPTRTLAERSLTPRAILGRRAAHTCRSRRYGDAMPARKEVLEISGREVVVSNPDKVFFPRTGHTKLDLVRYYLSVADGAVRGVAGRPMALKRFVNGAEGEFFFQKRAPTSRPDWIEVVELAFPSGRTAEEIVVRDAAQLAWVINLGCIDLNPHPVRAEDLDHPDELRVDLDPIPGVSWPQIREVALLTREVLADLGVGGGRGRTAAARSGSRREGGPGRPGDAGVAEDFRVPGVPRVLPDRATLDVSRGTQGSSGPGPGGRAPGAGARIQPLVERGTPRGVPRLQPERQGPDGRLGVLGATDPGCPRVNAAVVGRGARFGGGG